jgi:hypothetical protein
MNFKILYFFPMLICICSCLQTRKEGATWAHIALMSQNVAHDKLEIPKHWIEITNQNGEWVVYKPNKLYPLKYFNLTSYDEHTSFEFLQDYEELVYNINEIKMQKDSLLFLSLADDLKEIDRVFIFKYIDKRKNIAQWGFYWGCCGYQTILGTYVPVSDTSKFKSIDKVQAFPSHGHH